MGADDDRPLDVNEALRAASRSSGRARTRLVDQERRYPEREQWPVDQERVAQTGSLELGKDAGVNRYFVAGELLTVGQPLEVYTNHANGWLRGRFEWSGRPEERPTLAIHLWNPGGARDADGLPPWVGELVAVIPERAVCRTMD
jgi:hypothetical protein